MKLIYRSPGGRIEVETEVKDQRELVSTLGQLQELCEEPDCGMCGSKSLRHDHRKAGGYDYYELKCRGCGARLAYGQSNPVGQLWPKRRGENGEKLPARGWHQPPGNALDSPGESSKILIK